jgi:hypothetical protein
MRNGNSLISKMMAVASAAQTMPMMPAATGLCGSCQCVRINPATTVTMAP